MIVPWRLLVNDTDFVAAQNRQKIHKTPYFGVQGHPKLLNSAPIESQYMFSY